MKTITLDYFFLNLKVSDKGNFKRLQITQLWFGYGHRESDEKVVLEFGNYFDNMDEIREFVKTNVLTGIYKSLEKTYKKNFKDAFRANPEYLKFYGI